MIQARDIVKSYGGERVLRGVSLDVRDGECAVILGASGSGKSTLLSILSGLERADGGSVRCCCVELTALNDRQLTRFRRENVGFVFQQYYLLSHLSAAGNVRLGADLCGNADYMSLLAAVGLEGKQNSKPSKLSGGEQQRVCIARALAKDPRVLFLDEPTGALDEHTGAVVLDLLNRLQAERGFTMVTVTHNPDIALMADTVITMNSGAIVSVERNAAKKSAREIWGEQ